MKLVRITLVAASLALLGVACGGGGSSASNTTPPTATSSPSASGSGATTTTLTLKDNVFDPSTFTFPAGQRITLKNEGAALHNFSIEGQNVSHDVKPGETETEDIEVPPGTYTFFCKYHRALGMQGTITIAG
jgi:plastocyanin